MAAKESKVVEFTVDERNQVHAILVPKSLCHHPVENFNREYVMLKLDEAGLAKCELFDDVLRHLVQAYHARDEVIDKIIGKRLDCEVSLDIDEEHFLQAWLTIVAAKGGLNPTYPMLKQKLQEAGIVFGIKDEVLQAAVANKELPRTLVAEGIPPTKGRNAFFESLIQPLENKGKPTLREDGSTDYKDLNIVHSIEVGTPLLRKHLPTLGQPGKNILGEVLPPIHGENKFFGKLRGARIADDDPNLVIAAEAGQAHTSRDSAVVHPIFSVSGVNYTTGNIQFTGTVIVSGNVESGFKINAGGNIVIHGITEGADLQAKGYIILDGGVVGGGKAVIKAGGNITAKLIEGAHVESYKSIVVHESVLHSEVTAAEEIIVGTGYGKGQVSGGTVRATHGVKARIVGSVSGTKTTVEVGWNPFLHQKAKDLHELYDKNKTRLEEVLKSIVYLRTAAEKNDTNHQRLVECEAERNYLSEYNEELYENYQNMQNELKKSDQSRIKIENKLFAGSRLIISKNTKDIDKTFEGGCSFYLKGNAIILGAF